MHIRACWRRKHLSCSQALQFPEEIGTIWSAGMQDYQIKTLIIRFSSVGDIALSSPLIRVFHRRFPDAQIDFLVKEPYAELVANNPAIAHVITFPSGGSLRDLLALRRRIRTEGYTLILDLHNNLRSRILCAGLRNVRRINKRIIARFILVYTGMDIYRWFNGSPGVTERYFETVSDLEVEDDHEGLDFPLAPGSGDRAGRLLTDAGLRPDVTYVGICPMARHFTKMWPADRYAAIAAELSRQQQAQIMIFGSEEESLRCNVIAAMIRAQAPETLVAVLAGKCSLADTAALMDSCAFVITNDTGLMHVAAARKRPLVAIFGSTTRQLGFFPTGTVNTVVEQLMLKCRPCSHIGRARCPRGHFRCMLDTQLPDVLEAVRSIRETHPAS
jgi:lipopolysaccharide heptosyltransferase II